MRDPTGPGGRDDDHKCVLRFAYYVLDETGRSAWFLAFAIAVFVTVFGMTWILASHIAELAGLVAVVGGGAALEAYRRKKRGDDQN